MQPGPTQRRGSRPRRRVVEVIAALAIAGGAGVSALAISSAGASAGVVIATAKSSSLGTMLVSGTRTIYTLSKKDCNAKCLNFWPAVTLPSGVTKATAGAGVSAAKLGKVKDAKGAWQVTYAGKALYFFVKDKGKGQVKGNRVTDAWGLWNIVVTAKPAAGGTTTTTPPATTTTAPSGGGVSF